MSKWITRPVALFVVSVLLVALAAGAALAATVYCIPGAAMCSGTRYIDQIRGTEGPDNIDAGFGSDNVHGQGGDDDVYGSQGNDFIQGDAGSTREDLHGNDEISGGDDDDTLYGYGGSDYLNGGYEDDTIWAQEFSSKNGTDTVKGGSGYDDVYAADGVVDNIDCGEGFDYVEYDIGKDVVAANCEQRVAR